jgi:hypothetical protein
MSRRTGAVTNSLISNNVNIMRGSQVMLSVVSDRYLPFNAGLFSIRYGKFDDDSRVADVRRRTQYVYWRRQYLYRFDPINRPLRYHRVSCTRSVAGARLGGQPQLESAVGSSSTRRE